MSLFISGKGGSIPSRFRAVAIAFSILIAKSSVKKEKPITKDSKFAIFVINKWF